MTDAEATELFTPTPQEQMWLKLQGKCPHDQGWRYDGHGHNSDAYVCRLCGEMKWW